MSGNEFEESDVDMQDNDSDMDPDEFLEDIEEDEKDDLFAQEDDIPSRKLTRSSSFEVLTQDNIMNNSKTLIEEVRQVCGIPTSAAAAGLLRHFKYVLLNL
jgi:hypothetical protein